MTDHFQADGGIVDAHLVDQLAGNGQSIDNLAFITSLTSGNLELLTRGGAGTVLKVNYLDAHGTGRTGVAFTTGTETAVNPTAPEANGPATPRPENSHPTGGEPAAPSPGIPCQAELERH